MRYDTVDLRALKSGRDGQLNLAPYTPATGVDGALMRWVEYAAGKDARCECRLKLSAAPLKLFTIYAGSRHWRGVSDARSVVGRYVSGIHVVV